MVRGVKRSEGTGASRASRAVPNAAPGGFKEGGLTHSAFQKDFSQSRESIFERDTMETRKRPISLCS